MSAGEGSIHSGEKGPEVCGKGFLREKTLHKDPEVRAQRNQPGTTQLEERGGGGCGLRHFPFSDSALQRNGHLLRREKQFQFGELATVLNCGQRGSVARTQQSPKQDEDGKLCKGQGKFTSREGNRPGRCQSPCIYFIFILRGSVYCFPATSQNTMPHWAGGGGTCL